MSFRSIWLALLLLALASPAAAQEGQPRLQFFSHPTQRFNILVPPGWQNRSDETRALLTDEARGQRIQALSVPTADVEAGIEAAVAQLLPDAPEGVPADTVNLTNGQWQQRLYRLPDGTAATLYAQVFRDVTYVILYENSGGAFTFVQRVDAPVENADAAAQAMMRALALTGVTAQPEGETILTETAYVFTLAADEGMYAGFVRPSGSATVDVSFAPVGTLLDQPIILTVVRDFFVTPDTSLYLYLGLAAVAVIMALFVLSLIVRLRSLRHDEAALNALTD